jgi:hypothetical protein
MTESNRLGAISQRARSHRDQNIDRRLREKVREAKARGRSYEGHRVPPVMVRGGIADVPLPLRKTGKSKARRRFDVTLGMPGAEMRLPALPQITVDFRLLSGVLVAALAFLVYHLWNSPSFRVEEAEIVGLQRLNSRDVNAVLDIEDEPIFAIDPEALTRKAQEAFPEFASIQVEVGLPRSVRMTVEERQPILTWKQEGRTVLVDASGVAFPQRDLATASPALVVEAFSSPPTTILDGGMEVSTMQFMPVDMVSAILSMSAQAPQDTPLVYDSKHGLGWRDSRGWDVYLGDTGDIDMKLRIYQAMVAKIRKERLNPVLVSVEYPHAPYFRLER